MSSDFHVRRGTDDHWIVHNHAGANLMSFQRRHVAEAYGKALAHRAKVSLLVHHCNVRIVRYSETDLTYRRRI